VRLATFDVHLQVLDFFDTIFIIASNKLPPPSSFLYLD
jgi:hypothetical protein